MYEMYIGKVCFPVTPGKITYKINGRNKTVTLINEGEVNLIKTTGLTDITIDSLLLPTFQEYPFSVYRNGFHTAGYYLEKLEKWKNKKKPVKFKLVSTTPWDSKLKLLSDTEYDVTIEDYEIIEDADKYGMDICVKLNMKQYRYWGAKKLRVEKQGNNIVTAKTGNKNPDKDSHKGNKKTAFVKKTRKSKDTPGNYIVKKGDCLMYIARKQLGDASRWKEIYNLNQKVIETEAKKRGRKSSSNGYWIYPGTKLKLPA